jgi:hypothetical protein
MADSEELVDEAPRTPRQKQSSGDFPSMGIDLIKRINFKVAFFILILSLYLFSDVFVEQFLPSDYQSAGCANTKGTTVQMIILVLSYILIDLLVQGGMI